MHNSLPTPSSGAPAADPAMVDAMLDQAFAALDSGQLPQAQAAFEAVLQLDAQQFDAWNMLGVLALQAAQLPRALELFDRAIACDPDVDMAHTNRGVALMAAQQPEQALPAFERALALAAQSPEALAGHGAACVALQRWDEALASLAQAVALQPGNPEAHFNRAHAFLSLQRYEEALAAYNHALALQPAHAPSLINRGHALLGLQRFEEAIASYDKGIALQPDRPLAHARRGDALLALGRYAPALASYDQALALHADQPEVLAERGSALYHLGRVPEAVASYERALPSLDGAADGSPPSPAQAPQAANTLANLGGALRDLGRWDEALARCERALFVEPGHLGAQMNLANVLLDTGRWTAARDAFAAVEQLQPDHAEAIWGQGWCKLLLGDWATGWTQFERRWQKPSMACEVRAFTQPLWLGGVNTAQPGAQADLRGQTILLHAEQGLGDTLQFCRYVPQVVALGARVILEVQAPLLKLLAAALPGVQVLARGTPLPAFDLHCPLMSLPLAFNTTLATIPSPQGYLRADPALAAAWGARLGEAKVPRIGLVWSGNAAHRNDGNRSMALATLLAALPEEVTQGLNPLAQLYVLQKDMSAPDAATLAAHPGVIHLPQALANFDDTAALLSHMDVVISVDTSIAHLAGAMGKPVWVLLSMLQDWRWLLERSDSPWYASARLFRQHSAGQWREPLLAMAQALPAELAQWQTRRTRH